MEANHHQNQHTNKPKTTTIPLIIAMKGHPGTGKTTLATALAAALHLPLLDKDDIKDSTLPLLPLTTPSLLNDISYEALFRLVKTQLLLGLSVIVDSPLSHQTHLDRLRAVAEEVGGKVVVIECRARDEAEWRRRVERRGAMEGTSWHKPGTWEDVDRLLEGYAGCSEFDVGEVPRLVVDTTVADHGVEEAVAMATEFLAKQRGLDYSLDRA